MSLDPRWLIVVPILLGHVVISVVIVNVTHAIGLSERRSAVLKVVLLGAIAIVATRIGTTVVGRPWESWPLWHRGYSLACLVAAFVVMPLVTIARSRRRLPEGCRGPASEIDLAEVEDPEALIGTGRYSWMFRLPGNESLRLRKVEWELAVPGLPAAWDGLSLTHLSDFHFAPCFRRRFFEVVADEAASWDSDIVAFTGDLIDHDAGLDWIVPVMSRIHGRLSTFAILGNHDFEHHPDAIHRALLEARFTHLEGRWEELERDGSTLAVGGTSYPWGPRFDPRSIPDADFRILLSHTPDRFPRAARAGIDLVLSGHNHAGQVRLPVVGPVFMPSLYSRHYDRGFFRKGASILYVSPGIAGQQPLRFGGCVPEVTRFVLRVANPSRSSASTARGGHFDKTLGSVIRS